MKGYAMPYQITAKFDCPKCGCNPINLKFSDENITDVSVAFCQKCDVELGNYGHVRMLAAESAVLKMRQYIITTFKSAGWKI